MAKKIVIALAVLAFFASLSWVFRHSAVSYSGFWDAFVPSAWANVIGVSVAAAIGIPIGFAINHYVLRLAEERKRRTEAAEARDILRQVKAEINIHRPTLERLGQFFPAARNPQEELSKDTQIKRVAVTPDVAMLLLSDVQGRRAISFRSWHEVDEPLLVFDISNYYARAEDLNRLLNLRVQHPTESGWDRVINNLLPTLWVAQEQVRLKIDQAIERLGRQATQREGGALR
jgi:hypothetical protein